MPNSTTRRTALDRRRGCRRGVADVHWRRRPGAARRFQPARHSQDEWLDTVPGTHRKFIDCASTGAAGAGLLFANESATWATREAIR